MSDAPDQPPPAAQNRGNVLQRIFSWLLAGLRPVMVAGEDSGVRDAILAACGLPGGAGSITVPSDSQAALNGFVTGTDPTLDAFMETVGELLQVALVIHDFIEAGSAGDTSELGSDFIRLIEALMLAESRTRSPTIYAITRAFGFIDEEIDSAETAYESTRLDRFQLAATQVGDYFASLFQSPTLKNVQDESDRWGIPLAIGFIALGGAKAIKKNVKIWSTYGWDSPLSATPNADAISDRTLSFAFDFGIPKPSSGGSSGVQSQNILFLTMSFVPEEHVGGPGLFLSLGLDSAVSIPLTSTISLTVGFDAEGAVSFFIPFSGATGAVTGSPNGALTMVLTQTSPSSAQPHLFGDAKGTRLQWRDWSLSAELQMAEAVAGAPTFRFDLRLTVQEAALVLKKSTSDGFLNRLLPDGETTINFDLTVGYATDRGVYFDGGGGLRLLIPLQLKLGPLKIQSLLLDIEPKSAIPGVSTDSSLSGELATSFGLKLGPIQASVQELGLALAIDFPQDGGPNISLAFKPPRGVGFAIDASLCAGGGFLFYDPDHGQYAGVATLTIKGWLVVDLIGIITTIPPAAGASGGPTYSMLFLVTVQFQPGLCLFGSGFLLNGIGGLIGVNRSMAEDVLRAGVKTHLLDSILFPKNPVANAPTVTSNLGTAFPPTAGHYVLGGMLQITYLKPAVLTLELGVAVEFNDDTIIGLFGELTLQLPPSPAPPTVRLQLDFVGLIDTGAQSFSFDGSLNDSKILNWPITGDVAVRYTWGDCGIFLFSFGGFHPKFTPPPSFPKLDRLALSISAGLYRVRFEMYVAVTSNSFQLGARADFFAGVSGFSLEGHLAFDVLIEWNPFHFDADIDAQVALKAGGTTLLSLSITVDWAGPGPWHLSGKVSISILFWSIDIPFDKTFGDTTADPPPTCMDATSTVVQALQQPSSWQGQLPAGAQGIVSMRQIAAPSAVLVHPLADLTVRQKAAPMGVTLSRIGSARLTGATRVDITGVTVNGAAQTPAPVTDSFAPGQFIDESDDEKLSQPSFELLTSGVSFSGGAAASGTAAQAPLDYDTIVVDPANPVPKPAVYHPSAGALLSMASFSAGARAPVRHSGEGKFANPLRPAVVVAEPGWVVASTVDLSARTAPLSFTQAKEAQRSYAAAHPADEVQLVAAQGAQGAKP